MQEGKKAPFLFAVTINALVNYYFFIGEVFFLVFYYITRYLFGGEDARPGADLRKNARKIPAWHPGRLSGRRHGGGTVHPLHCGGAQ